VAGGLTLYIYITYQYSTSLYIYPIGSMYGVYIYMLTKMGYIDGIHVTIYGSTMDPMGIYIGMLNIDMLNIDVEY